MTLPIRLEKLRFLAMEMRLAMRIAQHAPTDWDARMIARHVLVRAKDFTKHAGPLKNALRRANFDVSEFHKLKEIYAEQFEEYFQKIRDRLSAHVQDIEFREGIELWNSVDSSKSEFFADGAVQLYQSLEHLNIPGYATFVDFAELTAPAFDLALTDYRASGDRIQRVEMGADALAGTRTNTTVMLNSTPVHTRASQLALLHRWMTAEEQLLARFAAFPDVIRILKARAITDLVSCSDCLVTRPVPPNAPQRMDGLDVLLAESAPGSPNAVEQFRVTYRLQERVEPYRNTRNQIGAHLDESASVPLASLLKLLDETDSTDLFEFYRTLRLVFEKACRDVIFLRTYLADGQTLYGVLGGTQPALASTSFEGGEARGRVTPVQDLLLDTDDYYAAKLDELLSAQPDTYGLAASAFRQAFMRSEVIENIPLTSYQGAMVRYDTIHFRLVHRFLLERLEAETDPNKTLATLQMIRDSRGIDPDALTELLLRYSQNPKSAPFLSAIAYCLGDLANWHNTRAKAYLLAGLSSMTVLAVHARVALLRTFVRTEGCDRINRKPPSESFSNVLSVLVEGLGPEAKLFTEVILASQFCDNGLGSFAKPFEQDYADLREEIAMLAGAMVDDTEASRVADTVRQLAAGHDYAGICLYLFDELNGGGHEAMARELASLACAGVIVTHYSENSHRHLCGCCLRLELYEEALSVAEGLARSKPEDANFQILHAQAMSCISERRAEAVRLATGIEQRYGINEEQRVLIEELKSKAAST